MPLDFNIYTPELNKKPEVIVPETINNSLFSENPNKSIEDILNTPGFIENVWAKTMREQTSFTTSEDRRNDLKKFDRDDLYYGQDMNILEAQYEQDQSFVEKIKNTTLGAGLIASKSFLQTWDSTFNSISNIFNDDPTYKSDATKALVETMEDINNRFPIYKKLDNSFLNKASNTIWETLPQIGFTLGTSAAMFTMSAPLAFIAPETGGASLGVLAEEAFIGLNSLKNGLTALRTLNGVRTTLNGIKALQTASPLIRLGAMNLIASNAEANVEAYTNYKDLKKDFLKQGMSYEEAETRANNSALDVKSYNQKLLALTNMAELIPFSQPLSKLANKMSIFKLGTKLVGDNIDNLSMEVVNNSFIKKAVNRLVIGSASEGFEELAQGAGQKIIGDFYKKELDPNVRISGSQILGDVISEIGQRVTTEEGIKEIASGFIIGGVMQGGGTAVRNTANAIGGLPQTVFGGKSESQELQEKVDKFNEALKDINNKVKISPLFNSFYEKAKANVINNNSIINALSEDNQDIFSAKSAEEANKAELFKHLHSTGLGESFWEKLDEVNNLTPDDFKKFFNTQGEIDIDTFKKVSGNLRTQYNNYAKISDNIDTIYNNKIQSNIRKMAKNNIDENKIKNYAYSYHQAKYLLADSLHMGNSAKIRFSQLSDEIRNKTNQSSLTSLFVELINNPQNVISDLKSKIEISKNTIENTSDNNLKESAEQELNKSKEQLDFINNNLIGKPEKIISFLGDNVKFQKLAELYNFNNPETLSSAKDIIDLIKIQDLIKTSENTYKFYSKEDTFFKVMNLYKTLEEQKENLTEKVNNDFEINKIKSKINKILTSQEELNNQTLEISENQELLIKEALSEKEITILVDYLTNKKNENLSSTEKKLLNIFKENVDSRKIENQNRFDNFKDKFKQSEEFIENKISEINKVNIEKENIYNLIKNLLKLKTILNEIKSDFENIKDIKNLFDFENIELKIQILETTINNTLDKLNEQKEKYKINLKKLSNLIEDDSLNNDLKNITVADELLTLKEKAEKILAKFPNVVNPIKFDIFSSITQEIKKFKSNIKKIFDYDDQNKIKNERIEDYNFTDGVANIVKEDNYIDEDGVVIDVSDGIVIRHNLNGKTVDFKIERFDNITDSIIDKIVSDQINIDNDTSPDIKSINLKYKALEYKLILLVLNGKINIFDKDAYLEQYVKELKYKTRKINELRELAKNKKSGDILSNIVSISEPSEGFIGLVVNSIKDVFEFLKTTNNFKDFNEDDLKFNFDTAEGQYTIIINHKSPEKLNTSIKIKPKQISTIKFNNLSYEEVLKQLITDYESYEENKNIIKFILPYINKNGKNISFDIFDALIQNSNNFEKTIEDFVKEYKYNFIGFGNIKDDNFLEDLKNILKKIGYNEDLTIDIINGLFVNKSYIINDKEEKTIIVDKKINKYFTFKINSDDSSILDTSEEKSPNDNPIESFSGLQINTYDELEFKTKNNVILDINNLKHLLQIIKNKSNSEISKNKIDLLFSLLKELKSLKIKFKKSENNNYNFTGNYNVNDGIIIYLPADKNFNNNKLINVLFEETSHPLLNNKKLNEDQKKEFAKKISVIKNKIIEFIQSAKYDNYIEKLSEEEKNSLFGPLYYSFTGQFINNENIKNLNKDLIIDTFKSSINDSTDSSDYLKNVEFLLTSLNGNNIELIKFLNQIDKIEDKTIFETLVQEVKLLIQAILGDSKGKIIEDIYNELFWLINVKVSDNVNKSTDSKISKTIQSKSQDDVDNVVKFLNSKLVSTDKTVSEDDNYEYDLDKVFKEKNKKSEQVGSVVDENIEAKKADIERRRQEDLQKGQLFLMNDGTYGGSRLVSLEEYSTIQIQENNLDSDITKWDYNTFNDTGIFVNLSLGVAYIVPNNSYNGKKAEVVKVFINKITKRFDLSNPRIINTPNIELVAKAANIDSKELYNEVLNAITKYDAELAALEQPVSNKKADIERRIVELQKRLDEDKYEKEKEDIRNSLTKGFLPTGFRLRSSLGIIEKYISEEDRWISVVDNIMALDKDPIKAIDKYFNQQGLGQKISNANTEYKKQIKPFEEKEEQEDKDITNEQIKLLSTKEGILIRKDWSLGKGLGYTGEGTDGILEIDEDENGNKFEAEYYLTGENDEWIESSYFLGKTKQEVIDKINAKYDAELAELGKIQPKETIPNVEAKKEETNVIEEKTDNTPNDNPLIIKSARRRNNTSNSYRPISENNKNYLLNNINTYFSIIDDLYGKQIINTITSHIVELFKDSDSKTIYDLLSDKISPNHIKDKLFKKFNDILYEIEKDEKRHNTIEDMFIQYMLQSSFPDENNNVADRTSFDQIMNYYFENVYNIIVLNNNVVESDVLDNISNEENVINEDKFNKIEEKELTEQKIYDDKVNVDPYNESSPFVKRLLTIVSKNKNNNAYGVKDLSNPKELFGIIINKLENIVNYNEFYQEIKKLAESKDALYFYKDLFNYLKLFEDEKFIKDYPEEAYNFKRQIEVSFLDRAKLPLQALIETTFENKPTIRYFVNETSTNLSFLNDRIENALQNEFIKKNENEKFNFVENLKDDDYYNFMESFGFVKTKNEFINIWNSKYKNQKGSVIIKDFYKQLYKNKDNIVNNIKRNNVLIIVNYLKSENKSLAASFIKLLELSAIKSEETSDVNTFSITGDQVYEMSQYGNILNKLKDLKNFLINNPESNILSSLKNLPNHLQRYNPKYNPYINSSLLIKKINNLSAVILNGYKINDEPILLTDMDNNQWWNFQVFNLLSRGFVELMRAETKKTSLSLINNNSNNMILDVTTNNIDLGRTSYYIKELENEFFDYLKNNFKSFIESLYYNNNGMKLNVERINNNTIGNSIFSYLNEWKFDYNNEELTLKEILLLNNSDEGFNNLMNMLKNSDNIFEKNKERILNEHRKHIGNINNITSNENTLFKKLSESDTFDFLRKADYSESSILNTLLNQLKENKINYNEFKNLVTNITYYNWVVLNIEQLTLFTGELSSFSNLHKRLGLDVSTGTYLSVNDDVQKFHTNDFINTTAINTLSQINENTLLEDIKNIDTTIVKSSVISEVKQSSSLFGGININDTIFKHTLLYKGLQESLNSKNIKIEDSTLFEQFKGYGKNTIADGQGYIDFDMYRRVMMDTGEWFNIPDNNRPLGYEYIKAKERLLRPTFNYDKYNKYLNINKTASESKEEDIKFVKNIEEKLNKKEIYFDFPPLKLGAKGEVIKNGKLVLLGDKFSVFPLIYDEKTIGTPQEQMIDEFRKNGIGYVKMKSGTKIDLYNELGEVNFDVISNPDDNYKLTDSTIHNIPSRFIKRQLATPSKIKKETIFGTQFRALLTAFQYNEGKFVNPHLEKPLTDYENSLLELTNYHTQKLFRKFGITDNGIFESLNVNLLYKELKSIDEEENNFEFEGVGKFNVDFKKAREIFIKSIENRGLSDNLNGLFEIVDGKFKYNLEATTSKKVIENLIRGLVNRDIIRQKSNGGMSVLVSSLFTGKKENSKLFNDWKNKLISSLDKSSDEAQELFRKIAMLGTEGVAFYRTIERNGEIKVLPAECKKTFSGDFKNLLNLSIPKDIQNLINKELINLNFNTIGFENYKIGNLNNLNVILNLMKNIRINRKEFYNEDLYKWYEENLQKGVLTTSYRIPTQTYNSMEVFEIIEFLPEYYGDILIPPMEIVVKSGSDYDIDKLPTLNPNISIQGIVYDSNLLKYIEDKNLTKDYFKILEEQKSFIKDIKKEIKDNSEKLIELVKEHYLLSTPHIELSPENKILKDNELLKYKTINFKSGGKLKTLEDLSELTNTDETAIDNRISYLEEEIEKIKNEIKDIKEVKKEIYDYVDEYNKYIYAKKFNYKLYQNDIINNSIKILLDISNYYELLLPNSTSNIDKEDLIYNVLKSKNGKNFADQTKGIKGFNAILPQTQNLKFITMFGAMKLLGVFAVNNKFLPIIQKSNLPLKKYSNFLSTSNKPIAFDKNESGVLKSLILSEFINLSVDAPSDDKLGFLNLNMDNIGFFVFNLLNNVDPETMYHYIEQPVIKSFEKMLKKEMEKGKKNSYQDLYKNLIINLGINFKIPGTDTFIDGLELNEKNIPRYNKENFKLYLEFIVKYYSNNFKTLKDKNNNSFSNFKDLIHKYGNYKDNYSNSNINLLIIAFYYLQKTNAKNYRETISMMQPDTQGVYSSDSSNKKQDFLITKDSEIVDSEGIENIINNSVISSFFKHNIFLGLSKLFFPISHDISILNNKKLFYEDVFLYKTDKNGDYILDKRGKLIPLIKNNTYGEKLESALNLWNNDFIAYLTQNYIINDEKLGKKAERLIKIEDNIDENKQFIFKFKNIIDTLIKSGHTNIILSTIRDSIVKYNMSKNNNNDLNKYHNIYFKNIKDNDILKNQFLYSLKELYDKEQLFQSSGIKNVKEIIEELALALFYQSGLNKSIISFTDIIPIEILSPIIQKALNDFKYLDQDNKKILINDFNIIFAKLNPQFFKTYRQIDFYSGKWESGFNPESYRGKNYTTNINIDKLKKSSSINLLIQNINDNFVNFDKELLIKLNLKEC